LAQDILEVVDFIAEESNDDGTDRFLGVYFGFVFDEFILRSLLLLKG
jgi:hypothetical protein